MFIPLASYLFCFIYSFCCWIFLLRQ